MIVVATALKLTGGLLFPFALARGAERRTDRHRYDVLIGAGIAALASAVAAPPSVKSPRFTGWKFRHCCANWLPSEETICCPELAFANGETTALEPPRLMTMPPFCGVTFQPLGMVTEKRPDGSR